MAAGIIEAPARRDSVEGLLAPMTTGNAHGNQHAGRCRHFLQMDCRLYQM